MAVPKKRSSILKKRIRKNIWKRGDFNGFPIFLYQYLSLSHLFFFVFQEN
ncbi:hypothetical protein ACOSQ2_021566 [Xanthoceras sorbifolium]